MRISQSASAVLVTCIAVFFGGCSGSPAVGSCIDETCMSICADRECGPSAFNPDYSCGTCGTGDCVNGFCQFGDDIEESDVPTDIGNRDTGVDPDDGNDATGDDISADDGATDVFTDDSSAGDPGVDSGCIPECGDRNCGVDPVCGEPCGECSGRDECIEGKCKCMPLEGRECGDDGCGGSFGECPSDGQFCDEGICVDVVPDDMVKIPAGTFTMGCATGTGTSIACDSDEKPAHEVSISQFFIDRTEVTRGAFKKCVEAGECDDPNCNADVATVADEALPVGCVTHGDAAAYCAWKGRRLPTEAEWEYAARYNDGRVFPWGDNDASCTYAHMYSGTKGGCGTNAPAAVCSKSPTGDSELGLCDMAGNAWEWVSDYYSATYYEKGVATDPQGPASGLRQVRGGGWNFDMLNPETKDVRSTNRYAIALDTGLVNYIGFRCAM